MLCQSFYMGQRHDAHLQSYVQPVHSCERSQLGLSIYMLCERYSDIPYRWSSTWSAFVRALMLCGLLVSIFCVPCHEEVTILVMLLAESLHCLLLSSVTTCGHAIVLSS